MPSEKNISEAVETRKTPSNAALSNEDDTMNAEQRKFNEAINHEHDTTMLVLRTHLYTESLLERVILLNLPRGDKLIEASILTYAQKLLVVDSLDCIKDPVIASLRNINKLRNQCAHELSKSITDADVIKIGSPLGKFFTAARKKAEHDPAKTLQAVFAYVCGYMAGACSGFEDQQINTEPKKNEPA